MNTQRLPVATTPSSQQLMQSVRNVGLKVGELENAAAGLSKHTAAATLHKVCRNLDAWNGFIGIEIATLEAGRATVLTADNHILVAAVQRQVSQCLSSLAGSLAKLEAAVDKSDADSDLIKVQRLELEKARQLEQTLQTTHDRLKELAPEPKAVARPDKASTKRPQRTRFTVALCLRDALIGVWARGLISIVGSAAIGIRNLFVKYVPQCLSNRYLLRTLIGTPIIVIGTSVIVTVTTLGNAFKTIFLDAWRPVVGIFLPYVWVIKVKEGSTPETLSTLDEAVTVSKLAAGIFLPKDFHIRAEEQLDIGDKTVVELTTKLETQSEWTLRVWEFWDRQVPRILNLFGTEDE